jgi:hypothetical protein
MTERTLYQFKAKYLGLQGRSGSLDKPAPGENPESEAPAADLTLDKTMLQVVLSRNAGTWHSGRHASWRIDCFKTVDVSRPPSGG